MDALRQIDFNEAMTMTEEEKQRFEVKDNAGADWCLRKIKALKEQQDENGQLAEAEVKRIMDWLNGQNEKLQNNIAFFESLLIQYHIGIYNEDAKKKTISLPHGKLKARAQQPEFIRDDKKLVEYLKNTGQSNLVEVIEKPKWGEFKKNLEVSEDGAIIADKGTGELVDCIKAEIRPPKFSVEV
jgi:hypothetical protein